MNLQDIDRLNHMRKPKVGDKVRCIAKHETYWGFVPDQVYRVAEVSSRDIGLTSLDGGPAVLDQDASVWWEKTELFVVEDLKIGEVCTLSGRRGVKPHVTV